jgi:nicotinamidase-related amidase
MPVLVIVDMQQKFRASLKAVKGVNEEIVVAKRKKWHIVFLEYFNCGSTLSEVKNTLGKYGKIGVAVKHEDNGAAHVARYCQRQNHCPRLIRVCGVNANACVKETAAGLAEVYQNANIVVVAKASRDIFTNNATGVRKTYKKYRNLPKNVFVR